MFVNLLKTCGLVPQPVYPKSYQSSNSSPINTLKLWEHALSASLQTDPSISPESVISTLRARKEELMREVHTIMRGTLGVSPNPDTTFTWEYYTEGGNRRSLSPSSTTLGVTTVSYTLDELGNIWRGRLVLYVNSEIDGLKQAIVRSIKAGQPVFFGYDVGTMDVDDFEYEQAFNITLGLTKTQRLQTNQSAMTHAMVISSVENAWSDESGVKGFDVMSEKWFDQFVYQVVVHRSLPTKEQ
ncbi:cysteine proteinase [Rhizopogon vinicolor AM-OR11-026]|uniref:Cysteine proteinase n=1 Tax=Rhizopogon vinicolor AM-OR11-026 TaxID=1314800 RepID=A0A1B7MGN6_9AGAM|nr:cysteine proteinase [Rhizopogon vinicolor AM-OR11-026]